MCTSASASGAVTASGRCDNNQYFPAYTDAMRTVAVLAYNGVSTFGLGVTAEVFGCDRSDDGLPRYDYVVTAARPGMMLGAPGSSVMRPVVQTVRGPLTVGKRSSMTTHNLAAARPASLRSFIRVVPA